MRVDLFNIGDIVALKGKETLLVQCTSTGVAGRVAKVCAAPHLQAILEAGWSVQVWGWRKSARDGRYKLRRVQINSDGVVELAEYGSNDGSEKSEIGCAPERGAKFPHGPDAEVAGDPKTT